MTNHRNRNAKKPAAKITRAIAAKVLEVGGTGLVKGIGVAVSLRALKIRLNDSPWSSDQARAKGLRRLAIAQLGSAGFLDESKFICRLFDLVLHKTFPAALGLLAERCRKYKEALIAAAENSEKPPEIKFAREALEMARAAAGAFADAIATYADVATDAAFADAGAAYAATAAADAAYFATAVKSGARDKSLAAFCEDVVQILIEMRAPGCAFLDLAPPREITDGI